MTDMLWVKALKNPANYEYACERGVLRVEDECLILCLYCSDMKNITPGELKEWLANNKPLLLIDVREQWEHDAYNIGGMHIPVSEIMARKNEIPRDTDVVMYCEKGIRSNIVIQRLEPFGFSNLYNLEGGMTAWKKAPSTPPSDGKTL